MPAPDPVGEPAEPERAEHRAGEISAVGKSDVEIGEMQRRTLLQRTRQRACQRDLQSIQNPGDTERNHDAGVEAAPAQTVETRGNAGFDDAIIIASRRPSRGGPRYNCRVTHGGHAALLQCLQPANSRNAMPPFCAALTLRKKPTRERLGIQCSNALKHEISSLAASHINAFGTCEFLHCGKGTDPLRRPSRCALGGEIAPAPARAWLRIAQGWMSLLRKRPQSDEEAFNAQTKAKGTGQDDSES